MALLLNYRVEECDKKPKEGNEGCGKGKRSSQNDLVIPGAKQKNSKILVCKLEYPRVISPGLSGALKF